MKSEDEPEGRKIMGRWHAGLRERMASARVDDHDRLCVRIVPPGCQV